MHCLLTIANIGRLIFLSSNNKHFLSGTLKQIAMLVVKHPLIHVESTLTAVTILDVSGHVNKRFVSEETA